MFSERLRCTNLPMPKTTWRGQNCKRRQTLVLRKSLRLTDGRSTICGGQLKVYRRPREHPLSGQSRGGRVCEVNIWEWWSGKRAVARRERQAKEKAEQERWEAFQAKADAVIEGVSRHGDLQRAIDEVNATLSEDKKILGRWWPPLEQKGKDKLGNEVPRVN